RRRKRRLFERESVFCKGSSDRRGGVEPARRTATARRQRPDHAHPCRARRPGRSTGSEDRDEQSDSDSDPPEPHGVRYTPAWSRPRGDSGRSSEALQAAQMAGMASSSNMIRRLLRRLIPRPASPAPGERKPAHEQLADARSGRLASGKVRGITGGKAVDFEADQKPPKYY